MKLNDEFDYNNRRYDNHILYARSMDYNNEQLFNLSQRIIYDFSDNKMSFKELETGIILGYDFSGSDNKMSFKEWETKLGIHHKENNYPNEERPTGEMKEAEND